MGRYLGDSDYQHGQPETTGVLLTNLGTPDAPTRTALRRYLKEFLWDPRVVELPRPIWWLILNGIILNIRPGRSAEAYATVWSEEGSPLLAISRRQVAAFRTAIEARARGPVQVALGMRYGNPSIRSGLEALRQAGARRILVLPLYPQYSAATTASTMDAVADVLKTWRWVPELRFVNHYHDDPGYIAALAQRIRSHWAAHGRGQRLVFSFHGVPKRYLLAGDPYHCHCHKTARLVAEALELGDSAWELSFQSRFGREEWLRPYTDERIRALPGEGRKRIDVCCPGFSADCLETLEEIAMQNREFFEEAGGEHLEYIPALNDQPRHIEALADIATRHAAGWPEFSSDWDQVGVQSARARSRERALALGAER
jgi:ferrochelatase